MGGRRCEIGCIGNGCRCAIRGYAWERTLNKKTKLLLCSLVACSGFCSGGRAQQLIVHPGVEQTLTEREKVRALFSMRLRRWPDGTPVRVFVLPDQDPTHRKFSKAELGVFPHQLRRAWDRAVFSGTGQAPTEVLNEAEMLERVAVTPGAVGYVSDRVGDRRVRFVPVE